MIQFRTFVTSKSRKPSEAINPTHAISLSVDRAVVSQSRWMPSASEEIFTRSTNRPNPIVRAVIALVGCFVALAVLAIMVGRVSVSAPMLVEYSTAYAPGHLVPADAACTVILYQQETTSVCTVIRDGQNIILNVFAQQITRVVIEVPPQRIGDLIAEWGTPITFSWSGSSVTVSWSDRTAHFVSCTFSPNSSVGLIEFRQAAPVGSPWRGFVSAPATVPCQK